MKAPISPLGCELQLREDLQVAFLKFRHLMNEALIHDWCSEDGTKMVAFLADSEEGVSLPGSYIGLYMGLAGQL